MKRGLLLLAVVVLAVIAVAPFVLRAMMESVGGARARSIAKSRGIALDWGSIHGTLPSRLAFRSVVGRDQATGDTLFLADSLAVTVDPWSVVSGNARIAGLAVSRARVRLPRGRAAEDTLPPDDAEPTKNARDTARGMKRSLEWAIRLLAAPAREMPRLALIDLTVEAGSEGSLFKEARIAWLELSPQPRGGVRFASVGTLVSRQEMPFALTVDYGHDDRLSGGARCGIRDPDTGETWPLVVTLDGALTQDPRRGLVTLGDSTRVTVGRLPFTLGAALERRGPAIRFRLAADDLTGEQVQRSLPPPTLGPLARMRVRGSWSYRLAFDLDLEHPDSVDFKADVIPNGLALESAGVPLFALDGPITATIHLPGDRIVTRELSFTNPNFRPLLSLAPSLVGAVVTNEDGGFFRHRGFSTEAVRQSIAENIKAGGFRRGAGTITMQLVRNLYLGHRRTLSRKFQEVVLAWMLENLTSVSKERLLEVYLNVIEWGPGIHGANEAAWYYFDHDAGSLTVDESLFLSTIIPAPARWRSRFDAQGELRRYAKAQMHFIGRAMIAKGWLAAEDLPPADSLRVVLRGPARQVVFPEDTLLVRTSAPPVEADAGAPGPRGPTR